MGQEIKQRRRDRIPQEGPAEGHGRIAPDLVVEVTSPNDSIAMVELKVNDYLAAGVRLIWVVVPEAQTVSVYRPDHTGARLRVGDFLDGEDVLPGFRYEVAALFA
jgi:Uma2 family endonuclease